MTAVERKNGLDPTERERLKARFDEVLGKIEPVLGHYRCPLDSRFLFLLHRPEIFDFKQPTGINYIERHARDAGVLTPQTRIGTRLNPTNTKFTSYFYDKNGVIALVLVCVVVGKNLSGIDKKPKEYWRNLAITIRDVLNPGDPLRDHIHVPQEEPNSS